MLVRKRRERMKLTVATPFISITITFKNKNKNKNYYYYYDYYYVMNISYRSLAFDIFLDLVRNLDGFGFQLHNRRFIRSPSSSLRLHSCDCGVHFTAETGASSRHG